MKKVSKIVALISCIALLIGAFAGCGGNKTERVLTDGSSFTYWCSMDGASSATLESYADMLFYQEMEKRTGIHIDFIHPVKGSQGTEAFVTMISSSDLPDMIEYTWSLYSGGPELAIEDGVIIALNDYLEEYAPNYYNWLEGEEGKKRDYSTALQASTDKGYYYGFNVLNLGDTEGFCGLYARGDLLEKWGLEVPETIDEWDEVLATAKANGIEKPITGGSILFSYKYAEQHDFNTGFDVGKAYYLEGDEVVWGPKQKGYKEYIAKVAEWAKKGYVDLGFVTNDQAKIQAYMTNGTSLVTQGFVGSGIGTIQPAGEKAIPGFQLVACPYPSPEKGKPARFQQTCNDATTVAIAITTQCGNYEKAIGWCDFIYSEEGIPMQLFGKEGDTYTVEYIDGEKHYIYTDKVLDYEAAGFPALNYSMYHYALPANHPGFNQHNDYVLNYYQIQCQKDAVKTWNLGAEEAVKNVLPNISLTAEEKSESSDLDDICQATFEVELLDIILGKKSIDTYDEAVAKYWELGFKRQVEIRQAAYERYLAKKDVILND